MSEGACGTSTQSYNNASHDTWKLVTVADPGSKIALVLRGPEAIPLLTTEIAWLAQFLGQYDVTVFSEEWDNRKDCYDRHQTVYCEERVPSPHPKMVYLCFSLSTMLGTITGEIMDPACQELLKVRTNILYASRSRNSSTSRNSDVPVSREPESAACPLVAAKKCKFLWRHCHRDAKCAGANGLSFVERHIIENHILVSHLERPDLFPKCVQKSDSSLDEGLPRYNAECGFALDMGRITSEGCMEIFQRSGTP